MVKRALISCVVAGLLFWRMGHEDPYVKFYVLNRLLGSFSFADLVALEGQPGFVTREQIKSFGHYYDFVSKNVPGRPDALALAGFCQAKAGRVQEALDLYERSIQQGHRPVWVYYNAGLLYLHQGDIAHAKSAFQSALAVPVEVNMNLIANSKLYLDIVRDAKNIDMSNRLKGTYALSYEWMLLTDRMLSMGEALPMERMNAIPRIF